MVRRGFPGAEADELDHVCEPVGRSDHAIERVGAAAQKPGKPQAALPQTGDASMLPMAAAALAGIAALGAGASRRRKE